MKFNNYEEELDYLINLVESDDKKDWIKASLDLSTNMHPDSLRKSWNVGRYSGYNVAKYYQNKIESDILADEEVLKIEKLKDELFKERCRLQDKAREQRNILREQGRFENLVNVLQTELDNLKPYNFLNEYKPLKSLNKKYATLCLSDWHCGSIIDNQFNYYDIEEMKLRVDNIKNKAIYYCKMHEVTDLIIEVNGDMVDGAIHISSRIQQEEDVVHQIVTVSNVLANVINALKPYFESIKVYCTLGNHGRLTAKKNDSITKENFEMLIPEFLRQMTKDIKIIDSKGLDFLSYKIDNNTICMAHGQNDKITSVIDDFSKIYKEVPDEVHLGHTHSYKDINDCNCVLNINGSLIGADDYALSIRKINEPSQNLIIYEQDRCVYELKAN